MRLPFLTLLSLTSSLLARAASTSDDDAEAPPKSTIFNGMEVPPMKLINGPELDSEISRGNWLVEYFSPWCGHCKHMAPILQTAYEFYYTSNPLSGKKPTDDNLNSFTRYYDFKFGKVDCTAFGDACEAKEAQSFPTLILYKDGKQVKKSVGTLTLPDLSHWIEECLETIRPGSRPAEGVKLPEVGASSVDTNAPPDEPLAKDKDPSAGAAAGSKHNALGSKTNSALEATGVAETPNPSGASTAFDLESFQQLVATTTDSWFIKFYAPWCHHCQAMGPNWQQMAKEMKGRLNVGEVNCEAEKKLCKDAHIRGYPTLYFYRGGERVEYDGLRGLGDLISFAEKAVVTGVGVEDVDFETFTKLEETEEVIFIYFYDHATTSEDFAALDRLVLPLVGHARLVKTKDPKLISRFRISTWPRLAVSRDGKPSYYTPLAPEDMRDVQAMLVWIKSVWIPIVPELTASNAREVMDGKLVVLGILNRDREVKFEAAKREIKNAALEWIDKQTHMMELERQELRDAKQLRIEEAEDRDDQRALRAAKNIRINMEDYERKQVGFAWVDAVFWDRWIRTTYGIDGKDDERVIINDEDNHHYWDVTIDGDPIRASRSSILDTLRSVTTSPPKIPPKSTGSTLSQILFHIKSLFGGHPILMFFVCVILAVSTYVWRRKGRSFRGKREGYFVLGEKDGLLGGGFAGGKVD